MWWLAIYAAALHQGDRLQANSVVQKLGERDRVYVLTQTVPLQKKKTTFKKRLESHIVSNARVLPGSCELHYFTFFHNHLNETV